MREKSPDWWMAGQRIGIGDREDTDEAAKLSHIRSAIGLDVGFVRNAARSGAHGNLSPGQIEPRIITHTVCIAPDATNRVAPGGDR
jgi:hypothetical protein